MPAKKFLQVVDFLVHDRIAEAHEAHSDHAGAPSPEATSERVRSEAELFHSGENPSPRLLVHLRVTVDGARDRPRRQIQMSREIRERVDGRAARFSFGFCRSLS